MSKDRNVSLLQAVLEAWEAYNAAYDEVLCALSDDWMVLAALRAARKYNRRADWRPKPTDLQERAQELEAALRKLKEAREKLTAAQAAYDARIVDDE